MLTRADVVGMYLDALLCTWNDKVRYEYARVKLPFGCLSVALLWRDHLHRMLTNDSAMKFKRVNTISLHSRKINCDLKLMAYIMKNYSE